MGVYIVQETEPFTEIARRESAQGLQFSAQNLVRRPTRGLEIDKDVYSYLKVLDRNGRVLPFINSGAMTEDDAGIGHSETYSNYLLQKVQIQRAELRQFVKTFGLTYLFFFGENPITASIEGALVHSRDFTWDDEWWANYEDLLRGSKLAERGARAYLSYEGVMLEGYVLEAATSREAMAPHLTPLGFQMVITQIKFLRPVGKTDYPRPYGVGIDLTTPSSYATMLNRHLAGERAHSYSYQSTVAQAIALNRMSAMADTMQLAQSGQWPGINTDGLVGAAARTAGVGAMVEGGNIRFGSFGAMFRMLAGMPGQLAGSVSSATSFGRSLLNAESSGTMNPIPHALRGKIRDNKDEYVGGCAKDFMTYTQPTDRVQRYMQVVEEQEAAPLLGDASREVIGTATDQEAIDSIPQSEAPFATWTQTGNDISQPRHTIPRFRPSPFRSGT